MGTFLLILQILAALVFVILMAVQTDKAEQSGVMGLGGQGGRSMGAIDMPVGAERILKPMSKWVAMWFALPRRVTHPRITRKPIDSGGLRVHHVANLRSPDDLDDDLRELLAESYDFAE